MVIRWAREVKPAVIALENVEEWVDWGPLLEDGEPCPDRVGLSFRLWLGKLKAAGYVAEWRELRACDYGAPTTRKRLFLIARSDGQTIVWPKPTHGRGLIPYRSAAECIDWTHPCPSIFTREKPLVENTLARIARGVKRFVLDVERPFVVPSGAYAPTLIHSGNGEREGQDPRVYDIHKPLGTIMAQGVKHALVAAFLAKHYGGHENSGSSLFLPMATITTIDHHAVVQAHTSGDKRAEVRAFLTRFNGQGDGQPAQLPLGTVTTKDRFGLVTVHGEQYEIADLGMRMLQPRELFTAQGFPQSYKIDVVHEGRVLPKGTQVRMVGNSCSPWPVAAIIRANVRTADALAA